MRDHILDSSCTGKGGNISPLQEVRVQRISTHLRLVLEVGFYSSDPPARHSATANVMSYELIARGDGDLRARRITIDSHCPRSEQGLLRPCLRLSWRKTPVRSSQRKTPLSQASSSPASLNKKPSIVLRSRCFIWTRTIVA